MKSSTAAVFIAKPLPGKGDEHAPTIHRGHVIEKLRQDRPPADCSGCLHPARAGRSTRACTPATETDWGCPLLAGSKRIAKKRRELRAAVSVEEGCDSRCIATKYLSSSPRLSSKLVIAWVAQSGCVKLCPPGRSSLQCHRATPPPVGRPSPRSLVSQSLSRFLAASVLPLSAARRHHRRASSRSPASAISIPIVFCARSLPASAA